MELELESAGFDGTESFRDFDHLGDTIADFDTVTDLTVVGVCRVVIVGHEPFIYAENTTGLQDLKDLSIDTLKGRSVDSGFDCVAIAELLAHVRIWGRYRKTYTASKVLGSKLICMKSPLTNLCLSASPPSFA